MIEQFEPVPFDLEVRVARVGTTHVVTVSGELDVDTAPPVRNAVDRALDERPPSLVLDLTGLAFFGSPGLSLLVSARERAEEAGGEFAVVATGRAVLRPLEVTGVLGLLDVRASLADALSG
ncbi:STAS domain-containing protein [Saccharothrix syringae]|uniref:STAS domain-containing protein n=1 Tax=Saccharothrix syringae TaxID=103733 RepID=UPI000A759E67|nr:STAS domain-containing protein [Saccharothrix syringae]